MEVTDTLTQDVGTVANEQTQEQAVEMFTQEDVNKFVQGRVADVEKKYSGYEEYKAKAEQVDELVNAHKTELDEATNKIAELQAKLEELTKASTIRDVRSTVAERSGVPANLLTGQTEEECQAQADAILAFAKPHSYPSVKDGGEAAKVTTQSTANQFAEWMKSQF